MADSSIIITASLLCICLCIPAISWRCFSVDQLRKLESSLWKDNTVIGMAAFLITTLINHLFWLVSSIVLLIFGRKGFKPVIWLWIVITWAVIILDFAFFGYFAHTMALMTFGGNVLPKQDQLSYIISGLVQAIAMGSFYMLTLVIHCLMLYLTIKVARYATNIKYGNYTQGTVIKTEDPPYFPGQVSSLRPPIANTQFYQNDAYAKSADDVRYGTGYRDRPSNGRFKQHPPDEPMRDYNDRRGSRYNAEFRY